MAFKVIDVSRYQGEIDWQKVKADGVKGAMLKTVSTNKNFGGIYIDPYFEKNYAECKKYGIPCGVYYYTYAQDKVTADAELAKFKEAITGKVFEYPAVVDVEDNLLKPLSADALTDLVEYALKTIEGWGMYAMVYTYLNYSNTELNMPRLSKYDMWLAAYRENRPTAWPHGMWQYSSTGSVSGINGDCDMNWAYKDYPAIIKNAGLNGYKKPAAAAPEQDTPAPAPDVEQVQPEPEQQQPTPEPETPAEDNTSSGTAEGANMKTLFKKITSRKLWAMLIGVAMGAAVAFGVEAETIETVAGAAISLISVVSYIYTEGKVDANAAAAAVQQAQQAITAVTGKE